MRLEAHPGTQEHQGFSDRGLLTQQLFNTPEASVNPEQRQPLNPHHQAETLSTASLQTFEDPEGGLALDSSEAQARQRKQRGRPTDRWGTPPMQDRPDQG
jgi:hypothetical protein